MLWGKSMYATIRRYDGVAGSVDALLPDGRRLAAAVGKVPGFVAYTLLDAGDGVLLSVSFFESAVGLAAADQILERWAEAQPAQLLPYASAATTGEVIVQKGM